MSPRALTAPPTDRRMWRRALARLHPDTGGDGELFVWAMNVRETICGGELGADIPRRPPRASTSGERVPFEEAFDKAASFSELTRYAAHNVADDAGEPYARLLRALGDCYEASPAEADSVLYRQQHQGATYKQLAAIAYRAGMSKEERIRWYRIAESIPLAQRHAGHILGKLQQGKAA